MKERDFSNRKNKNTKVNNILDDELEFGEVKIKNVRNDKRKSKKRIPKMRDYNE